MWVYLDGGPDTGPSNVSSGDLDNQGMSSLSFSVPPAWPVGSWTQIGGDLGQSATGATTFTFNLGIYDPNWSGWVYIDDVVMK